MTSEATEPASEFVLGVDLDGVVADFYRGLKPIVAEWFDRPAKELPDEVSYGLTEWGIADKADYDRIHRFAVVDRGLFERLVPIPHAPATLRRLSRDGIRIRIITHRLYIEHIHETTIDQTVAWLDHYGIPYWDICFMRDKVAVGANLYVDDSPHNIEALRSAGNDAIVFTGPTNKAVAGPRADSWNQLEQLIRERSHTER